MSRIDKSIETEYRLVIAYCEVGGEWRLLIGTEYLFGGGTKIRL